MYEYFDYLNTKTINHQNIQIRKNRNSKKLLVVRQSFNKSFFIDVICKNDTTKKSQHLSTYESCCR